jgi:hypothetical protein
MRDSPAFGRALRCNWRWAEPHQPARGACAVASSGLRPARAVACRCDVPVVESASRCALGATNSKRAPRDCEPTWSVATDRQRRDKFTLRAWPARVKRSSCRRTLRDVDGCWHKLRSGELLMTNRQRRREQDRDEKTNWEHLGEADCCARRDMSILAANATTRSQLGVEERA